MPNRNQTGPFGGGPRTGRGSGLCGGNAEQTACRGLGGGMGRGRGNGWGGRGDCRGNGKGNGQGRGRCNGWGARGFVRWISNMGTKIQTGLSSQPHDGGLPAVETGANRQDLERQAEWLRAQLNQVEERLNGTKQE